MRVFDVDLPAALIDEIAAHAERDYPIEACGVVLAPKNGDAFVRVIPMKNMQDKYHARDPIAFSRDGRDAFRFDELEHMRVVDAAEAESLAERAIYHSHCDAGAYFSPEDRAAAVQGGLEMIPGAIHLVVSVRRGRRADMAAFRYDATSDSFEEARIPLVATADLDALPQLELRAMEGREAARPLRPVGGALVPRRITHDDRVRIDRIADKMQIRIESETSLDDITRFSLGLLSPLSGFLRTVEIRSIEQSGRLLSGAAWRTPVTLEIAAKRTSVLPLAGALLELVDAGGRPRAAMGLIEVHRIDKDKVRLAGPIYAFDGTVQSSAADTRAELLRRGAKRVLAIGPAFLARSRDIDLSQFDVVLRAESVSRGEIGLSMSGRDPWLDAAMAQNQGATHVWVEDHALAHAIEETLAIVPWKPDAT